MQKEIYVAGWNIPGYQPEMEPVQFDDETDAKAFLTNEIDRMWDQDYMWDEPNEAADNRWMDLHSFLPYETAPFNLKNGDGSLTFWVGVIHNSES